MLNSSYILVTKMMVMTKPKSSHITSGRKEGRKGGRKGGREEGRVKLYKTHTLHVIRGQKMFKLQITWLDK